MPPPTSTQLGKAILKYCAPSIAFPPPPLSTNSSSGSNNSSAVTAASACASTSSLVSIDPLFQFIHTCARRVDPQTRLYVFGSTRVYGFSEASAPMSGAPSPPPSPPPAAPVAITKPVKNDVDIAALSAADVAATAPTQRDEDVVVDKGNELTKSLQVDFLEKLKAQLQAQSQQEGQGDGKHPAAKVPWEMEVVKRARVPVLRIQPQPLYTATASADAAAFSAYNADVTYGRRCGVLNSALLRRYMDQQPHLRYLCLVVKRWSKLTGLNTATSPDGGGLTSYGFHLLVVYYALRRGLVQYVAPESVRLADIEPVPAPLPLCFPGATGGADDGTAATLSACIEHDEAAAALVGEWALDFVRFYLREFAYEQEVVSISRGTAHVTTEVLHWTKQEEYQARSRGEYLFYRFCIEDPYEVNLNVGRHMSSVKLMIFKKHLEKALETGLSFFPAEEKKKKASTALQGKK